MMLSQPMLGRTAEVEALELQLQQAHQGPGRQVAIVAQSGAGKTTLLEHIIDRAKARGEHAVLLPCRGGNLVEHDLMRLLVQRLLLINPEFDSEGQRTQLVNALRNHSLSELEHFLAGFLGIAGEDDDILHSDYIDYNSAITRIIRAMSADGQQLVLAFDDADDAEVSLLNMLIRICGVAEAANVFILITATRSLPENLQSQISSVTSLRALTRSEIVELARFWLPDDTLSEEAQAQFVSMSHGLPLPVTMIASAINIASPGEVAGLPTMIQAVKSLAQMLTPDERHVLNTVAVIGGAAPAPLFQGLEIEQASVQLTALVTAGWLAHETGTQTFRFKNNAVRLLIYDYIPSEERVTLHEKIGVYFFNQEPDQLGRRAVDFAVHHFVRSGQRAQALDALALAINKGATAHNLEARRSLLKQAIEISAISMQFRSRHIQFAEQLGDLYAAQDNYTEAASAYNEPGTAATPLHLLTKLGLVLLPVRTERAVSILNKTVTQMPNFFPEDLKWRAVAGLVWGLLLTGKPYEALREGRNALATLNQLSGYGDAVALIRATLGMVYHFNDEVLEAKMHFESARGGWLARGNDAGLTLINRIQAKAPRDEATQLWLRLVLHPILGKQLI